MKGSKDDMSHYSLPLKKSLLHYSEHLDRATVEDEDSPSMPPRRRRSKRKTKKSRKASFKVKHGRITLHIPGYQGVHTFTASDLIHKISHQKIKAAAKLILKKSKKKKFKKLRKRRRLKRKLRKL